MAIAIQITVMKITENYKFQKTELEDKHFSTDPEELQIMRK